MSEKRKHKTGMLIKSGANLYNLHKEKWEVLKQHIKLEDWAEHIGHVRFGYNGTRYSFVTAYNKKYYEYLYN